MFSSSNLKKYVHPCIVVLIMLLGFVIPPVAPITEMGMAVIFIFAGMIWGWSTCGMLWPSLLGVVMLGFSGYAATPEAALGMMLTNTTFVATLVTMILFAYINEIGLLDILSTWVVTRKFAAGKPWTFMTFLFFAFVVIAPFAGNPVILILLGFNFVGPLLKKMGYTKEEALPTYMMIGISLCGLAAVWPYFLPISIYTKGIIATAIGGYMLTGLQYTMCIAFPLILSMIIYLLVGKFIVRIDTKKFAEGSKYLLETTDTKITLTVDQKRGVAVLLLFCLAMLIPTVLPKTWAITQIFTQAGLVGSCIVLTVAN